MPNTWFEYEQEFWGEFIMQEDQMNLPEDIRPYDTPRNPHCRKELWKSQDNLQEEIEMRNPEWYPKNTIYNIYNQPTHENIKEIVQNNDRPKS